MFFCAEKIEFCPCNGYNRIMEIFAERLISLRKERGLTQATVAKDLGISLGIVCFWEANKSDPTATNVAKVARYFNVSADYLLGLDEFIK